MDKWISYLIILAITHLELSSFLFIDYCFYYKFFFSPTSENAILSWGVNPVGWGQFNNLMDWYIHVVLPGSW